MIKMKTPLIILIIVCFLLVGCSGVKTFDVSINKRCEDVCMNNNLSLDYGMHAGNNEVVCKCVRSFIIQKQMGEVR